MMSLRRSLIVSILASLSTLATGCASTPETTSVVVRPTSSPPVLPTLRASTSSYDEDERNDDYVRPGAHRLVPDDAQRARGLYLSVFGGPAGYDGDLEDGGRVFNSSGNEELRVPETTVSPAFGLAVSNRWTEWEMGLYYTQVEFDSSFSGDPLVGDMTTTTLDLMFRRYWNADGFLQPYVTFGFGQAESKIDGGGLDSVGGHTRAKLVNGVNYNLGIGVSQSIGSRLNFWGQALRRFGRYETVSGPQTGRFRVSPRIDSDGWELSGGVSIMLLRERTPLRDR